MADWPHSQSQLVRGRIVKIPLRPVPGLVLITSGENPDGTSSIWTTRTKSKMQLMPVWLVQCNCLPSGAFCIDLTHGQQSTQCRLATLIDFIRASSWLDVRPPPRQDWFDGRLRPTIQPILYLSIATYIRSIFVLFLLPATCITFRSIPLDNYHGCKLLECHYHCH